MDRLHYKSEYSYVKKPAFRTRKPPLIGLITLIQCQVQSRFAGRQQTLHW